MICPGSGVTCCQPIDAYSKLTVYLPFTFQHDGSASPRLNRKKQMYRPQSKANPLPRQQNQANIRLNESHLGLRPWRAPLNGCGVKQYWY